MNFWAIGLFGSVGAILRFLIERWTAAWWSSPFPWGTLLINLSGCLVLGWFSTWTYSRSNLPAWLRLSIGTGLIGSFTTFSTFSVETLTLLQTHLLGDALLYVLLSMAGGIAFSWFGYQIYRLQSRRKIRRVKPL
jgi:CrcB protein